MFKNCPQGLWLAPFIQIAKMFFSTKNQPLSYYVLLRNGKVMTVQTLQKNSRRGTKLTTNNENTSVLYI